MIRAVARVVVCAVVASLLGCAEATRVQSLPNGAAVYAGDRLIGITPTIFRVPRSEWRNEFALRLEHEGYEPAQVTVPTIVGKGRIVGGIFTLGIVWLFKRPTTLPEQVDVRLVPVLPAPVAAPASPSVEERLRALQKLYDGGLITQAEYQRRRGEILNQL
jgi:putative oligomerization/nucleic acid binding protein/PEGA domain-containing protein